MNRAYDSDLIENFLNKSVSEILGILADSNEFATEQTQKDAWKYQIEFCKKYFLVIKVPFILNMLFLEWVKGLMFF